MIETESSRGVLELYCTFEGGEQNKNSQKKELIIHVFEDGFFMLMGVCLYAVSTIKNRILWVGDSVRRRRTRVAFDSLRIDSIE